MTSDSLTGSLPGVSHRHMKKKSQSRQRQAHKCSNNGDLNKEVWLSPSFKSEHYHGHGCSTTKNIPREWTRVWNCCRPGYRHTILATSECPTGSHQPYITLTYAFHLAQPAGEFLAQIANHRSRHRSDRDQYSSNITPRFAPPYNL